MILFSLPTIGELPKGKIILKHSFSKYSVITLNFYIYELIAWIHRVSWVRKKLKIDEEPEEN